MKSNSIARLSASAPTNVAHAGTTQMSQAARYDSESLYTRVYNYATDKNPYNRGRGYSYAYPSADRQVLREKAYKEAERLGLHGEYADQFVAGVYEELARIDGSYVNEEYNKNYEA